MLMYKTIDKKKKKKRNENRESDETIKFEMKYHGWLAVSIIGFSIMFPQKHRWSWIERYDKTVSKLQIILQTSRN